MNIEERRRIEELQTALSKRALAGEEPAEEAEFDVQVEVDTTGQKRRLYFYLTEAHGYYVETIDIDFYYKPTPDTEYEESPLVVPVHLDEYLKANEVGEGCIEVVHAELDDVSEEITMGTSENWEAVVVDYGRARAENPDPLPPAEKTVHCD